MVTSVVDVTNARFSPPPISLLYSTTGFYITDVLYSQYVLVVNPGACLLA